MDEEIDRLVVSVRADTAGFARDVDTMRATLEGPIAAGADRAGRAIESSLIRAVTRGKLGFDDLEKVALSALSAIVASAIRSGIDSLFGGGDDAGSGRAGLLDAPLSAVAG